MEPISQIDPSTNQLFYRGYNVGQYSNRFSFETFLYLLINGHWPSDSQLAALVKKMQQLRNFYTDDIDSLFNLAASLNQIREDNMLDIHDTLLTYVTLAPLVVANELSKISSNIIKRSNNNLGHVANFLWMTKGSIPAENDLNDFQTSLILHMDDPDNPSLSRLRTTLNEGKTISDVLVSTLTVHTDSLHHGAGIEAMTMFREIRAQSNIRNYLKRRVDSGDKIYGLGHRIYTGIDPRAVILREMLKRRTLKTDNEWLLRIADTVAKEGSLLLSKYKGIDAYPNVDLYNAAVYATFGYPAELNTSLFAISRAAGWMAHILEYFGTL